MIGLRPPNLCPPDQTKPKRGFSYALDKGIDATNSSAYWNPRFARVFKLRWKLRWKSSNITAYRVSACWHIGVFYMQGISQESGSELSWRRAWQRALTAVPIET